MKHIARKRFGQHFLTDGGIIDAIVRAIAPAGPAHGGNRPGLAALTQPLVERLGRLTVIELDRDLAARLRAPAARCHRVRRAEGGFHAAGAHAGRCPKSEWSATCPTTSPRPSCSTCCEHVQVIEDQHFMLQKEVIDRMVARRATSDYSRLSVMLQWRYAMENVLFVPPESFDPPPRVDSAVVRMVPHAAPRRWMWRCCERAGAGGLQPAPQTAAPHPGPLAGGRGFAGTL
jgi:16S rRNA (adenine1518-N6/adenine1519-N6)-dimethyltransferase